MNLHKESYPKKTDLFITVALSAIPVIIYFYYVKTYTVNVPFYDDFPTVFNFLSSYLHTDSFPEKVRLILSQQNEHRIAFNKIVVLIIYYLTKEVDLRVMMWIGNLSLIGLMLLFAVYLGKQKRSILYFLPVPFLLFQLQYHENIYWAMASVANLYIILFALCSIYCMTQTNNDSLFNRNYIIGLIAASIATFTIGNGIFTFFVINLILLYQGRKKQLIVTVAVMVAIITIYFYGYEKLTSNESILLVLRRPKRTVLSFLYFLGGSAGGLDKGVGLFGETYILLTGTVILLWIIYLFFIKYYDQSPFIFSCFIFLLITAAAATVTRSGYGQVFTLSPRYKIYSLLFIILSYLALIDILKPQLIKAAVLLFLIISIVLNLSFYHRYTYFMLEHKKLSLIHMAQWKNYSTLYTDDFLISHQFIVFARDILINAIKTDIYKPPQLNITNSVKKKDNIEIKIKLEEVADKYLLSNMYIPEITNTNQLCIILASDTQNYIFNIYQEKNTLVDFFKTGSYYRQELKAEIPKNQIQKGKYSLDIYSITPEQITFIVKTNQTIIN